MIKIQNIDGNECFKWSVVKYLNPANQKRTKTLPKSLIIKAQVKIRDIHKFEKKNSIDVSVFGYEKHLIYVSKKRYEENMLICYW